MRSADAVADTVGVEPAALDVVRAYFDAWNRRDLDALAATLDPQIEWERSADFPEGRTLRGINAVIEFARSMFEVFSWTPIELERCVEAAPGLIVVVGSSRFRGGVSGVETGASWVRVYTVAGGRIVAIRPYGSLEEALREATVG
jgi:ketosteroid isomerase-like protein